MEKGFVGFQDVLSPASYSQQVKTGLCGEIGLVVGRFPDLAAKCYPHDLNGSRV